MRLTSRLLLAAFGSLIGCSNGGPTLTFETGPFDVPPGESLTCFYTDTVTDKELYVHAATATQVAGGHHVAIYYRPGTDQVPTQHHPCTNEEMASWRQVAAAANATNGEPVLTLPDGAAIKIPKGHQIVVQAHYINTTADTVHANDSITLELSDSKDVKEFANYWVINDGGFELLPNASTTRVSTCTLDDELQSVVLLGHMHELGHHYKLETIDAKGKPKDVIYDYAWNPGYATHPPLINNTLDDPLVFPKGTRFQQTCTWNNDTPNTTRFPTEMCIGFVYYFPDRGNLDCHIDSSVTQ